MFGLSLHHEQPSDPTESSVPLITQAQGLPEEDDQLYLGILQRKTLEVLTKSNTDVEDWISSLEDALHPLRLENLLDKTIPRPEYSNPSYGKWSFWSAAVGWWMRRFIDEEMEVHLCLMEGETTHADDLFRMIKSYYGRADCASHVRQELRKWDQMNRAEYDTAEDFVIACENSCIILDRFGVGPPPCMALARLLDELRDELPKVASIEWELKDMIATDITQVSFADYCRELIDALRQLESTSAVP
ncbi:uncharacterized protein N7529_004803 [Penicillium soppii]|jgi:hypothetical protein|uniref:uncharacterized protein n=1 Tax=Penicillium soppii TaxID=69789 RepID=UPI002547B0A0|nr:uncharacterized protein N7529_004803 [Penicillium soppii]KAJ5872450.1 hypothetical protein N7529_004803 [Penicillium soppii]